LRISAPPDVKAPTMLIIAIGGLIINIIGAFLLHKESKENLNIQGAFLHIIGDLLGSVGTIIAGIIILRWNFYLADPIISIIIALLILYSSISLINEAVHVLMESTPSHINVETIRQSILEIPDVIDVHDLHVWSIASNKIALSVHIVTEFIENKQILCSINNLLEEKFDIEHSTIQIEPINFHENGCSLNTR
jgi:cobalt-zinc-cadmium efflux system protein